MTKTESINELVRRSEHISLLATMIYAAEIQVEDDPIATSYCVEKALMIIKEAEKQLAES